MTPQGAEGSGSLTTQRVLQVAEGPLRAAISELQKAPRGHRARPL